jgi:hypothetical protein
LSSYSRYPTDAERQETVQSLKASRLMKGSVDVQRDVRQKALEDMECALLTSKEFMFNY